MTPALAFSQMKFLRINFLRNVRALSAKNYVASFAKTSRLMILMPPSQGISGCWYENGFRRVRVMKK